MTSTPTDKQTIRDALLVARDGIHTPETRQEFVEMIGDALAALERIAERQKPELSSGSYLSELTAHLATTDARKDPEHANSIMRMAQAAIEGFGAQPVKEWQPIETAPQNSVEVLVCMNNGRGMMFIAHTPGTGQWFRDGLIKINTPTHWMHLPQKT